MSLPPQSLLSVASPAFSSQTPQRIPTALPRLLQRQVPSLASESWSLPSPRLAPYASRLVHRRARQQLTPGALERRLPFPTPALPRPFGRHSPTWPGPGTHPAAVRHPCPTRRRAEAWALPKGLVLDRQDCRAQLSTAHGRDEGHHNGSVLALRCRLHFRDPSKGRQGLFCWA